MVPIWKCLNYIRRWKDISQFKLKLLAKYGNIYSMRSSGFIKNIFVIKYPNLEDSIYQHIQLPLRTNMKLWNSPEWNTFKEVRVTKKGDEHERKRNGWKMK